MRLAAPVDVLARAKLLLHGYTSHSRELVARRQQGTIDINDQ
jgi:hypothetical protein